MGLKFKSQQSKIFYYSVKVYIYYDGSIGITFELPVRHGHIAHWLKILS